MDSEIIIVPLFFAAIFGIVYITVTARHRQRMAMIEKGMDPSLIGDKPEIHKSLRNGLFLLGVGLGLFLGHLMQLSMFVDDNPLPYFIMVMLCGGAALIIYHWIVRRKQQG
jgi:O-antigen ligase